MDYADMTPEQLREAAAEKERAHTQLVDRYMDYHATNPVAEKAERPAYVREVEFEGRTYPVDMRRTKSVQFVRMVGRIQQASQDGGEPPISDVLAMYDYLFGGEVADMVATAVRDKTGFDDFEETMRVYNALFEAVGAKN